MSDLSWGQGPTQFFYQLDGQAIFRALEVLNLRPTGTMMGLNSFENRVYELGIEPDERTLNEKSVVAKFYRPGRWSEQQILEEHQFMAELAEVEIPVIAPLLLNGKSLHRDEATSLFYCVYSRRGGRAPEDLTDERAMRLGRLLGRAHLVGKAHSADHRVRYTPEFIGAGAIENMRQSVLIDERLKSQILEVGERICQKLALPWQGLALQRIHGDLHPGNILERDRDLWILDFDDMAMGPTMQDFWMILPSPEEASELWASFAEGYEMFLPFPWEQIRLIPYLRCLRMLHFHGWISKRWEDPAFALAFEQYQRPAPWEQLLGYLQMELQRDIV